MTESEVIDAAREAGWTDAKVFINGNGALPSKWEIYRDKQCMLLTDEMIMKFAAIICAKQREKDSKDAERDRWLREEWSNRKWRHVPIGFDREADDITTEEDIDAVIDAAIANAIRGQE